MFCKNCGKEIDDNAVVCPHCGVSVSGTTPAAPATNGDAPSMGFAVLGFFFPIVGLILYLVWKDQSPLKAKSCGKGALTGFIVEIVVSMLWGVLVGCLAAMGAAGGSALAFTLL